MYCKHSNGFSGICKYCDLARQDTPSPFEHLIVTPGHSALVTNLTKSDPSDLLPDAAYGEPVAGAENEYYVSPPSTPGDNTPAKKRNISFADHSQTQKPAAPAPLADNGSLLSITHAQEPSGVFEGLPSDGKDGYDRNEDDDNKSRESRESGRSGDDDGGSSKSPKRKKTKEEREKERDEKRGRRHTYRKTITGGLIDRAGR